VSDPASDSASLSAAIDSVPDNFDMGDLMAPESSNSDVLDGAAAAGDAARSGETSYRPPSGDDDSDSSDAPDVEATGGDTKDSGDNELVDIDWYGKTFKAPQGFKKFADTYFTQRAQQYAEEHRAVQSQAQSQLAEAQRLRAEAEDYRARVQAHLDANPDFAESWNDAVAVNQQRSEVGELRAQLDAIRGSMEQEAAQRQVQAEISELNTRFRLEKDSPFSPEVVQKMALAEVVSSGYSVPLEHAWQSAVGELNRIGKQARLQRLQEAARNSTLVPKPTNSGQRSGGKAQKDGGPRTLDALLKHHLSMPDQFFEG
jgi:hypothetical protein